MIFEDHFNKEIKKLIDQPISNDKGEIDIYLTKLKESGASLIVATSIIKGKLNLKLVDAKELVLNSTAYQSKKEDFIQFQNEMFNLLENESDEIIQDGDNIKLVFNIKNDTSEEE